MSDFAVPYPAPYVVANAVLEDEMVAMKAGRGDDMLLSVMPAVLLRYRSEYFADRMYDDGTILIRKSFTFNSESPAHFRLPHPNLREMTAPKYYFRFITELFAFAGHFSAYPFRNALLESFFTRIASSPGEILFGSVQDVYDCTDAGSSLRGLVVDIAINTGCKGDIKLWKDYLPQTFLVDCLEGAAEDMVVMFSSGKTEADAKAWLEGKKERLCWEYYVHTREELMAGQDQDVMDVDGEMARLDISKKVQLELSVIEDVRRMNIEE